ncbi:MAG: hypothetical protein E6J20_18820 [Chloroflexi bacterium]|nr:MAG: hypothetical protein E6J20_18820 [Chloroflexota bacterium]
MLGTLLLAPLVAGMPTAPAAAAAPAPSAAPHRAAAAPPAGGLSPRNGACALALHPAGLCAGAASAAGAPAAAPPAAGTSASPGSWAIVGSPNLTGHLRDAMASVSCASASDCWAVGDSRSAGDYSRALTEHWDGSSWTLADAPQPAGMLDAELAAVACMSSSDCVAVGLYSVPGGNSFPFSERWDGTTWSLLTTPYPAGEQFGGLRGVACAAVDDCWAVGWVYLGDYQALVEHWDGVTWTISASLPQVQLSAVTCVATAACWAAGGTEPSTGLTQPFVARWDGASWTASTAQAPPGDQDAELDGISCASASVCWAVGRVQQLFVPGYQPLIEQWGSGSWSITSGGVPPTAVGTLSAVSCASPALCYAAGYSTSANGPAPLLEEWQGTAWTDVSPAAPAGSVDSELGALTCAEEMCWSVGSASVPDSGNVDALVYELKGGFWTLGSAPVPVGTQVNGFGAVSCVSATACVAVGSHTDGAYALGLVESWDGGTWSIVPSPSAGGVDTFLNGAWCVTALDCWAVGDAEDVTGTTATPVIESSDGSRWASIGASAPSTAQVTVLTGVTCVSATDCWAVGGSFSSSGAVTSGTGTAVAGIEQTLAEHWDGSAWSIVSSPNNSPADSALLESVSCVSSRDCWAAGITAGNAYSGLVEHWDGAGWQVVASPSPPARSSQPGTANGALFGVTCVDAQECWATGYSYLSNGRSNTDFETWLERWDGTSWTTVPSPNPSPFPADALFSVSCSAAGDCWAAGTYGAALPGGGVYETLTLHWDGASWNWVDSPNGPGNTGQALTGVTAPRATRAGPSAPTTWPTEPCRPSPSPPDRWHRYRCPRRRWSRFWHCSARCSSSDPGWPGGAFDLRG